jgi:hypothetical protein
MQVITGSSDSMVCVWDAKTCDCLASFRPPQALAGAERAVLSVHANPQNVDHILVCTRSNTAFMMTLQGQVSIAAQHDMEICLGYFDAMGQRSCPYAPPHLRICTGQRADTCPVLEKG